MSANIPQELKSLFEAPVAVIGHGVSGQAIGGLITRAGGKCVFYDNRTRSEEQIFDKYAAKKHKLAVFSPGFEIDHPWIEIARENGCVAMGELEFGARFWNGKLFCITGSNGKTTTTELIVSAFEAIGKPALAVGNIGRPLSDIALRNECEGKIAVCETSSFQAESADKMRIDGLIWLNLYENHLDRHGTMKAYFEAKWKLVERIREPILIAGETVAECANEFGYTLPKFAQVVGPKDYESWPMPRNSAYCVRKQAENLLLIRRFWEKLGLDENVLRRCAEELEPLPFRMNALPGPEGVTYWNDSKATNYAACAGALANFTDKVVWIGGGRNRNENPEDLARLISSKIRIAILAGETSETLAKYFAERKIPTHVCANLAEAVLAAKLCALPCDNVLFSPAHSSHDMYRDYMERGRHFESLVAKLGDPTEHFPRS